MDTARRQIDETFPLVLVVDDAPEVHALLRAKLAQEEIAFESVTTGVDAVRMASTRSPAMILLDLDLPDVHGFDVLKTLKDEGSTHTIPVIVLSGDTSPDTKVKAFDLGAVDFVGKPFEFTELRVRVRSALRVHQLLQMLAQKAQIDGLTGLWNRMFFDRRWAEEHARNQRHGHAVSVALIDVDHFKQINDTFGHPAGDAVLQTLARTIVRESRATDLACRYGGEEFALVMPDADASAARVVCERIREAISRDALPRLNGHAVTVSIGLAGAGGRSPVGTEDWIDIVDKNLYAAKRGGRNRIEVTDVSEWTPLRISA
jgi:diguanylate cyclase (GGDEF)-like protein